MPKGFKINHAGIGKILKGAGSQQATDAKAEKIAARARSNAPVSSGKYQRSIHVEQDPTPNRARSKVVADVSYALVVEGRDNVLARALAAERE